MANYTPVKVSDAGAANVASNSTTAGGDEFVFSGRELHLIYTNGHSSAITVAVAPTITTQNTSAGEVATPTRSIAIPAGQVGILRFSPDNANPYVNASGRIPVTYTGHNAALVVRAVEGVR